MAIDVQVTVQEDIRQVIVQDESNRVVVEATDIVILSMEVGDSIVVEEQAISVVSVGEQGPAGPAGPAGATSTVTLQAGEDLSIGDPVYVSANLMYKADNITNFKVSGVSGSATAAGFLATMSTSGPVPVAGLTPSAVYFLGNKVITNVAPTSGYVVRIGQAITSAVLVLNIEEPILLS